CSIMHPPILPCLPPASVSIISTLIAFQMSQNLRQGTEAASPPFRWQQPFSAAYIGNSPTLLIRAIAESRHVPTPGFLAYIIRYALPILIPILGLIGLIFFRG